METTLEKQIHQNNIKLIEVEKRIKQLEKIVTELMMKETAREQEAEAQSEFEILGDLD